MHSGLYN